MDVNETLHKGVITHDLALDIGVKVMGTPLDLERRSWAVSLRRQRRVWEMQEGHLTYCAPVVQGGYDIVPLPTSSATATSTYSAPVYVS